MEVAQRQRFAGADRCLTCGLQQSDACRAQVALLLI